jgi:hypothetical protein
MRSLFYCSGEVFDGHRFGARNVLSPEGEWKSSGFSRANPHLGAGSVFVVGEAGSDGGGDGARAPGSATHVR